MTRAKVGVQTDLLRLRAFDVDARVPPRGHPELSGGQCPPVSDGADHFIKVYEGQQQPVVEIIIEGGWTTEIYVHAPQQSPADRRVGYGHQTVASSVLVTPGLPSLGAPFAPQFWGSLCQWPE